MRVFRLAAAYGYGIWIAAVYIILQHYLGKMLIPSFTIGALLGGLVLLLVHRKPVIECACTSVSWIRALLFGGSQVFLLRALLSGDSTTVFAASSAAVLVSLPLSAVLLRERTGFIDLLAAGLSVCGIFFLSSEIGLTLNSVVAGLCQGASIVVARKAASVKSPIYGNLALGLIAAGMTCLPFNPSAFSMLRSQPLIPILVGLIAVLTQLYLLWMSFRYPANFVNQVGQTRIVWSIVITALVFSQPISGSTMVGAALVFFSAVFVFRPSEALNNR